MTEYFALFPAKVMQKIAVRNTKLNHYSVNTLLAQDGSFHGQKKFMNTQKN